MLFCVRVIPISTRGKHKSIKVFHCYSLQGMILLLYYYACNCLPGRLEKKILTKVPFFFSTWSLVLVLFWELNFSEIHLASTLDFRVCGHMLLSICVYEAIFLLHIQENKLSVQYRSARTEMWLSFHILFLDLLPVVDYRVPYIIIWEKEGGDNEIILQPINSYRCHVQINPWGF